MLRLTHANLTYVRINIKFNPTGKAQQPRTRERLCLKKIEKKESMDNIYHTGKLQKTKEHTKISHREIKEKLHKAKCLTGKVPQPKTRERLRAEKMEKKQHKAKCLTGKVPQPKTT